VRGASLARMAADGLPIPPCFYITTAAYRHFVMEHELQEQTFGSRLRCPRCEDVFDRYLPHAL
jgi:phosphoenolpyruvate synthase/pyruvate phosphate dikinase